MSRIGRREGEEEKERKICLEYYLLFILAATSWVQIIQLATQSKSHRITCQCWFCRTLAPHLLLLPPPLHLVFTSFFVFHHCHRLQSTAIHLFRFIKFMFLLTRSYVLVSECVCVLVVASHRISNDWRCLYANLTCVVVTQMHGNDFKVDVIQFT